MCHHFPNTRAIGKRANPESDQTYAHCAHILYLLILKILPENLFRSGFVYSIDTYYVVVGRETRKSVSSVLHMKTSQP